MVKEYTQTVKPVSRIAGKNIYWLAGLYCWHLLQESCFISISYYE